MVWTAFCREAPVGIDVEEERDIPDLPDLAAQLHPEEQADLRLLPLHRRKTAFYRCWTRKEAVLKALGTGLCQPLHSFRVSTGAEAENWILSLPEGARPTPEACPRLPQYWTSRDIPSPAACRCSLAAGAARRAVEVWTR